MRMMIKTKYTAFRECIYRCLKSLNSFASSQELVLIWTLGIVYKFALDAMYVFAASPQYSYAGLVYAPSFVKYVLSFALYLLIFAVLPKKEKDTVAFLLHLQFAFTVAPMLCFYALGGQSTKYMLMVAACVLLQVLLVGRGENNSPPIHIVGIKNYVSVMLGVLVCFTLVIPVLYNGFAGLKAFNFSYIYDMRAEAAYPPGFGYLLIWVTRTIIPFAVLYALQKRRYGIVSLLVLAEILFYMETGTKFTLFILIPVVAIYFLSKSGHLLKLLYCGFTVVCIAVIFAYQLDKNQGGLTPGIMINALVGIRAIFHPADNKFNFFECFSQYPKIHFSDGLVGKMLGLTYLYGGSSGQVVGAYVGNTFGSTNLNTGYLGESYAQFGFPGMLAMSALLAFVLRGLRPYDRAETFPILAGLFAVYMIILNDGALFTTLLTGGMLVAFVLVLVYFGKRTEVAGNGI